MLALAVDVLRVHSMPGGSETRHTPLQHLFKNFATFASVSPIWTRGTTL